MSGSKDRRSGEHYLLLFSTVSLYYRSFTRHGWEIGATVRRWRGRTGSSTVSRNGEEQAKAAPSPAHRANSRNTGAPGGRTPCDGQTTADREHNPGLDGDARSDFGEARRIPHLIVVPGSDGQERIAHHLGQRQIDD